MYFPILRSKQFELLALKEICPLLKPENKVHPIIEPVKSTLKALDRSLLELCSNEIIPTIVVNPQVGDLNSSADITKLNLFISNIAKREKINIGFHFRSNGDISRAEKTIANFYADNVPVTIVCTKDDIDVSKIDAFVLNYNVEFILIDNDEIKSRSFKRHFNDDNKILLSDPFPKEAKNADYLKKADSLFTEDHVYFEDEGYIGFADYLTVGRGFTDAGFLPYAVAIHLTYPANSGKEIRIRHFTSTSNDDDSDVPGKFFQALEKLVGFTMTLPRKNRTTAMSDFEDLHKSKHYPGLGFIKKLSILNHLELVNTLLQ